MSWVARVLTGILGGVGDELPEAAAAAVRRWCAEWRLTVDGEPFETRSSVLAPVLFNGAPAMLKIATVAEERLGNRLMARWNAGAGAAPVLRQRDDALLLERADRTLSLASLATSGADGDDNATRILVGVAGRLHADSPRFAPQQVDLEEWFRDLLRTGEARGGFYARAAGIAGDLLSDQREVAVLHGDVHHGNVLHFGSRGWLAIDPKGIVGDRAFDYANILCNPDARVALATGRLERHVGIISATARIGRQRMLRWTAAWCGLSATWSLIDGEDPAHTVGVGVSALRLLDGVRMPSAGALGLLEGNSANP